MSGIDRDGDALIAELERRLDDNTLALRKHAMRRALRLGRPNFLRNILLPMFIALFRGGRRPSSYNGRGKVIARPVWSEPDKNCSTPH